MAILRVFLCTSSVASRAQRRGGSATFHRNAYVCAIKFPRDRLAIMRAITRVVPVNFTKTIADRITSRVEKVDREHASVLSIRFPSLISASL